MINWTAKVPTHWYRNFTARKALREARTETPFNSLMYLFRHQMIKENW